MTCTSYFKLPLKSKNCVLCLLVVLAVYTIAVTYPLQVFFFRQSQDILRRLTMNQTSRPSSFKASEEWAVAGLVHRPDAADQSLFTTFPWKPDDTKRRQLLSYLNLTQQEASSHLPLTLQGPELLSNDSLCVTEDGSPVDVLFLVHTAPQHFERRRQMRNTFMAEKLFGPLKFKIRSVFLLGEVSNASQQTALEHEHVQFGDLLQGHFLDSYHNLSHKGVMGFRWVSLHCARVRLVVKLDDDVFFDTFKLLHRYWGHIRDKKRSMFCSLWKAHTMQILRDGRWTVEEKIFRNRTTFPYNYCSGLTVMMTGDMMPALFSAAKVAPVFWIDDVYLYGILPAIASNVTFYDVGYGNGVMDLDWKRGLNCLKEKGHECPLLAASALREQLGAMWNETRALYRKNKWRIPAAQV